MLKICICSDNHGRIDPINKILNDNQDCDYYFHLGDSGFDPKKIEPFISVKGNNDWTYDFPKQRIIELSNNKILLLHGDGATYSIESLYNKAIKDTCNVILFGHTHLFFDKTYKNIRFINPGSCYYNRDLSKPCYAIMTIDDNNRIEVKRVDL